MTILDLIGELVVGLIAMVVVVSCIGFYVAIYTNHQLNKGTWTCTKAVSTVDPLRNQCIQYERNEKNQSTS